MRIKNSVLFFPNAHKNIMNESERSVLAQYLITKKCLKRMTQLTNIRI